MLACRHTAGFTLVELVVVLILIGILSAYAAPRFSGRGGYSELTVRQDVKQAIRYAQQLAMSRTAETFSFVSTATQIDVRNNGSSVLNGYPINTETDVTNSAAAITFDRLGATGTSGIITINITGQNSHAANVCVVGTTGYVYDC